MVLKKHKLELPSVPKITAWTLAKSAAAAFLVRVVFYFLIALFFIWLISWAGIAAFSFKYVIVLTVGMFLFYLVFGKFGARY